MASGKCDRCGKEGVLQPFSFRYMERSNPNADSDGYVLPYGCAQCLDFEKRLAFSKWLKKKGFQKLPLKSLAPWLRFKRLE